MRSIVQLFLHYIDVLLVVVWLAVWLLLVMVLVVVEGVVSVAPVVVVPFRCHLSQDDDHCRDIDHAGFVFAE